MYARVFETATQRSASSQRPNDHDR